MSLEIDKKCLASQLTAADDYPFVSDEAVHMLKDSMTDRRAQYGQVICQFSGCTASCVIRDIDYKIEVSDQEFDAVVRDCVSRNS